MRWAHHVDVLDISDLRFPGGNSHSIAEEIKAQAEAGYTTGLVNLNGPLVAKARPVNPRIRELVEAGTARLFVDKSPISARLVVCRHPGVLQHAAHQLPPIKAERVVIVANAGPLDIDKYEHYRPLAVHEIAKERFGQDPIWAPIGPLVREAIADTLPAEVISDEDWVNIIDVDAWASARPSRGDHQPVIGRHSRQSPQKWPDDLDTLRAVYPDDGSWKIKVLGGAKPAEELYGQIPDSWEVLPFGAVSPREFLASLDFFVYYHNPAWVEAFGRTILEALAAGTLAVLPPHFEPLFGDAAVYAEPRQVRGIINRLHSDSEAYNAQVMLAAKRVRERFSYQAHDTRLARLIGPASAKPAASTPSAPAASVASPPRAVLISSNGAGMGHLTRLLAYATRCGSDIESHFLSLSQAVPVVGRFDYPYEYLPSRTATGLSPKRWNPLFAERVIDTLRRLKPEVVIFDGTWPYISIPTVRSACPEPRWIWSRRGMWQAGKNHDQLTKKAWFDAVIEPGDFASVVDAGVTSRESATRVGPVTLLDHSDLDTRAHARKALDLPEDLPLALVSLGAGNINNTSGDVGQAVMALRSLGVHVCIPIPEIATSAFDYPDDVHVVSEYPLSRRFRAFDLAVSAAGYNSFHELLRFGVPTLFVPNQSTALDDQVGRAKFAADNQFAHQLHSVTADAATPLLQDLLENGPAMASRVEAHDQGNGAVAAAEEIRRLAHEGVGG